ncbi:hypothetical protein PVK06_005463 [Gossypium arboreum]|uniref:Uncharacterized protein n=1 Tax=Gossypium arboreum TaxID=29729 RepID=A0ABR0QVN2_GOSAR|nr:hypothetical protein PVK06_005463 [Gossypium arboreum]
MPVESSFYKCHATKDEMVFYLAARRVRLLNFANNFDVVEGECRLSDTIDGFILPLYLLEVGFQLLLHPFFCVVLKEYRVVPRQLTVYRGGLCGVLHKLLSTRLKKGHSLILEELLTIRNVFRFYLEGKSPNSYKAANLQLGVSPRNA